VLLKVTWLSCSNDRKSHMGDEQWDAIDNTMAAAHANAYSSEEEPDDDEEMDHYINISSVCSEIICITFVHVLLYYYTNV
jgi:hypothetical protein